MLYMQGIGSAVQTPDRKRHSLKPLIPTSLTTAREVWSSCSPEPAALRPWPRRAREEMRQPSVRFTPPAGGASTGRALSSGVASSCVAYGPAPCRVVWSGSTIVSDTL